MIGIPRSGFQARWSKDSRLRHPGQGAEHSDFYSPDSFATIPVSNVWMSELMLARFPVVPENGHADSGTGHSPTIGPDRIQLSKSQFWSKFRHETQESILPEPAPGCFQTQAEPDRDGAAAECIEFLCT